MAKKHVGQILIDNDVITTEQLNKALEKQKISGDRLGRMLVKLGYATEDEINRAISEQINLPHISLRIKDIDPKVIKIIPEQVARKYELMPVRREGVNLIVAMDDPLNSIAIELLNFTAGMRVIPVIANRKQIRKAIEEFYTEKNITSESILQYLDDELVISEEALLSEQKLRYESKTALNVKSVNMLLIEGIRRGASDIHIELDGAVSRVRFRIDGVLFEAFEFPFNQHSGMVARIKVLSNLDLTERRLPLDGSFKIEYEGRHIDLRVSTIPMLEGENAAIRILVQDTSKFDLESLGLSPKELELINSASNDTSGLIISSGPTGSGKSTTLYSILQEINKVGVKIITVEDPVEYRFPMINQMSVKPSIGFDFANCLRSILRHDPDVILVGEIRDRETAEICIRAGLTGHLVLSTLHTRTAVGCPIRLIDIGIEPYLLADTIELIISQRLIRRLCKECKKAIRIKIGKRRQKAYKAVGCNLCSGGYSGRIGIFEVIPGDIIRAELMKGGAYSDKLDNIVREAGYSSLWDSGLKLLEKGETSLEELRRVLPMQFTKNIGTNFKITNWS